MQQDNSDENDLLKKLQANTLHSMPTMDPNANIFGEIEESKQLNVINIKQANARMEKWRYMLENQAAFALKNPLKCN